MRLENALSALKDREAAIHEQRVPATLAIDGGDTLLAAGQQYRLSDPGLERLCKMLGAPSSYLKTLPFDVRQVVLGHHLEDFDPADATIIARDNEFLGFGRSDLLRISGSDVLEAVQAGADRELAVHNIQFIGESFQADLLVESASEEIAPEDVLFAGIRVTHSAIGEHATWIESFILRKVCTNGLTHRECGVRRSPRTRRLPTSHPEALDLQLAQVRRLAAEVASSLQKKLHAIRSLRSEAVDVDHLLERWLERARLSARMWLPIIRDAWRRDGSQATAFGVMNALTWVATHAQGLSARQRHILSGLAGLLAFRQTHLCPRCFSVLGGPITTAGAE